jgi:RHS repeat-associated protein
LESETRTFTALAGKSYKLNYTYNQGDQLRSVNYRVTTGAVPGPPSTRYHVGKTWAPPYTVSGVVRDQQSQPVPEVTIAMSGAGSGQQTTGGSGTYSFSGLGMGNYTFTPSASGYVFDPSSITYPDLQGSKTNADFTALTLEQTLYNKTVNYDYNAVGALAGVGTNLIGSDPNATTNVLNTVSFRASGALKTLHYGNGRRLRMNYWELRSQPKGMTVDRASNPSDKIIDYLYEYNDASGNNNNRIRKITDNVDTSYTTTYLYDDYDRLTHATSNASSSYFLYDEWGNLKNLSGLQINHATNASGAPATNRISTAVSGATTLTHSYDAAGNMTNDGTKTMDYDGANRLKAVNGGSSTYGHDGNGMRARVTDGGAAVFYVHSAVLGQNAIEVTSAGVQRAYVYAGSKMVAMQATDGQFYWTHTNHLGNSRAMTDSNGNLTYKGHFAPFGQSLSEWSSSGNNNLNSKKFTGYERDAATGLDFANARMYNSVRGGFTTPDPVKLKSADRSRPGTLNLYSYVRNDPVNFIDPEGTELYEVFCRMVYFGDLEKWKEICVARYKSPDDRSGGGEGPDGRGGRGNQIKIKIPNAKVKTAAKEIRPGCGRAEFEIEWIIEDAGQGGWLIQHVIYDRDVLNADGSVKEKKTTEFWEAWKVDANGKVEGGTDMFSPPSFGPETRGTITVTGYAKYYEGYTLLSNFIRGGAGALAGDLLSTQDKPPGWTDENAYKHQLSVKFNCVGDGEPTEVKGSIP